MGNQDTEEVSRLRRQGTWPKRRTHVVDNFSRGGLSTAGYFDLLEAVGTRESRTKLLNNVEPTLQSADEMKYIYLAVESDDLEMVHEYHLVDESRIPTKSLGWLTIPQAPLSTTRWKAERGERSKCVQPDVKESEASVIKTLLQLSLAAGGVERDGVG
jgi:hypothetical protein